MLLQLKNFTAVIEKLCYCDAKAMLLAPKSSLLQTKSNAFYFKES